MKKAQTVCDLIFNVLNPACSFFPQVGNSPTLVYERSQLPIPCVKRLTNAYLTIPTSRDKFVRR